jgi:hypothetical protein
MTTADALAPGVVVDLLANLKGRLAAHIQTNQFPTEPLEKRLLFAARIAKNAPRNLGLHDLLDGHNPPVWMPRPGPRNLPKLPVKLLPIRMREPGHRRPTLSLPLLSNIRVGLELEVIHSGQKISQPVRSAVWLRFGGVGNGRSLRRLCRWRRSALRQIWRHCAAPFRDGNGRTQREFIRELGLSAGHKVRWAPITQFEMYTSSKLSMATKNPIGLVHILRKTLGLN